MEPDPSWKRRSELRFLIEAGATVEVVKSGQTVRATTVNMSGGGVLLHFEETSQLAVGDEVICEFKVENKVENDDAKPLPYWGVGSVVRVEDCRVAIMLQAGGFSPLDPETGVAIAPRI